MSYNILSDGYIKSQVDSTIKCISVNARPWIVFDFDYRLGLLRAEIMASQSDILCMQEVDHAVKIHEMLDNIGYSSNVGKARQGVDHVTSLVAYKKDKYELVWHRSFLQTHGGDGGMIGRGADSATRR